MKIKIIHLAKDNEIDGMECSDCGRSIRHAVEINGQVYGLDCGAKRLGWNKPMNVVKATFKTMAYDQSHFLACYAAWKALVERNAPGTRIEWMEKQSLYSAYQVDRSFALGIKHPSTKTNAEYIEEVYQAVK